MRGVFVTGTDTGVGKTFVAAALVRSLIDGGNRTGVLKPVATGVERVGDSWRSEDVELLMHALGKAVPRERIAPILFDEPLAPVVAARRSQRMLTQCEIERAVADCVEWWSTRAEVLVVEGIGGLLCPLAEVTTVADLAVKLDYPVLIVARRGLGTLNHTLLTVEAARSRGLRILGVILNGAEPTSNALAEESNAHELMRRLEGISVLADLPHGIDSQALSRCFHQLDWYARCGVPRYSTQQREGTDTPLQERSDDVQRNH